MPTTVNINEIKQKISVINARSAEVNNQRSVNLGKKQATESQLHALLKTYKEQYGVELSTETLDAEIQSVVAKHEEEYNKLAQVINAINSGDYDLANQLLGIKVETTQADEVVASVSNNQEVASAVGVSPVAEPAQSVVEPAPSVSQPTTSVEVEQSVAPSVAEPAPSNVNVAPSVSPVAEPAVSVAPSVAVQQPVAQNVSPVAGMVSPVAAVGANVVSPVAGAYVGVAPSVSPVAGASVTPPPVAGANMFVGAQTGAGVSVGVTSQTPQTPPTSVQPQPKPSNQLSGIEFMENVQDNTAKAPIPALEGFTRNGQVLTGLNLDVAQPNTGVGVVPSTNPSKPKSFSDIIGGTQFNDF